MAHHNNNQKNHHYPDVGISQNHQQQQHQQQGSRLILLQEYLHKITSISQEDYETLYTQIFELLDESKHKSSEKHFKEHFLEKFVDLYIQTLSDRVFKVLVGISAPLDECLFNILLKKIHPHHHHNGPTLERRCAAFVLISNIVHRSPTWLPNIINSQLLICFFDIMKNEQEIVILSISALILVELIAALPCLMSQYLDQIFSIFSRLCKFLYRGMNINDKKSLSDKKNLSLLNLNSIVYRLFIRLYAMYPCNFFTYLKNVYGVGCPKEQSAVFHKIIEPMLNKIRFHPLLITASKDRECDKSRWLYKEPHDILDECGQFSIDPIESLHNHSHTWDDDFSQWYELKLLSPDDNETLASDEKYNTVYQDDDDDSVTIFSQLQKEFNQKDKCTSLKATPCSDEKAEENPVTNSGPFESAQEAIMLSCKSVETTAAAGNRSASKNLVKPVAISATNAVQKSGVTGGVNSKKQICFSPFKPIKEIGTNREEGMPSMPTNDSKPCQQQNQIQSVDQFSISNSNENEDDDMEIIGYDLENKTKTQTQSIPKRSNDFGVSTIDREAGDQGKMKCRFNDDSRIPDDLVNLAKQQGCNKRNRYRSNCLPETDKEDDYYYSNGYPISPSANLRAHSESCPMLYFKSDDDDDEPNTIKGTAKGNTTSISGGTTTGSNNNNKNKQQDETRDRSATEKPTAKVNLILDDPNQESKNHNDTKTVYKTCKSVDFTKETKARRFSDHSRNAYHNKLFCSLADSQRALFRGSSVDFSSTPYKFGVGISSPHELLDRMLSTFSDVYLKEHQQQDSGNVGRRDSGASTSSCNLESLNFIGCHSSSEEEMRKILAIMYAQLVFERHQRDLHVIRNRRLYKKSKECIQWEERYEALRKQMQIRMAEMQSRHVSFEKMLIDFQQERNGWQNEITRLQEELRSYKINYESLQTEKINLEQQYRQEIAELNKNFRGKELELNRYLCNKNKNVDLVEKENRELKNQIFLFGEFCGKLRDAYCHSKLMAPDLNEKLILDSLRYENRELNKQNVDLGTQLRVYMDKCTDLENQLKQEELKRKNMVDSSQVEYANECIKAKDDQIEVLRTLVVNYETHIRKLTGELACKPSGAAASFHSCKT